MDQNRYIRIAGSLCLEKQADGCGNVVGRRINYDPALAPFVQFPFEFQDAGGNTVSNLADLTAISAGLITWL